MGVFIGNYRESTSPAIGGMVVPVQFTVFAVPNVKFCYVTLIPVRPTVNMSSQLDIFSGNGRQKRVERGDSATVVLSF